MTSEPRFRRIATVAVTALTLVLLLVLGTRVPVPFVALGPGPTLNTLGTVSVRGADGTIEERPVVSITGVPVDKTSGNLNMTTVSVVDGLTLFEAMTRWASGTFALQPRDTVYPPDRSTEEVHQENAEMMSGSEHDATAAALRFLKRPTKVVVGTISADGPAQNVLRLEDQVTRVGGTPVADSGEFDAAVAKAVIDKPLAVDIVRDGKPMTVSVTPKAFVAPDGYSGDLKPGTPTIGAEAVVVNADPALKITYTVGDIGGPSAGMMLSLAVIDLLSPGELTHGKFIAGTGTIDDEGQVGVIGGITHKTRAARDAGATVFLVPDGNCAEAVGDKPDGLELVRVKTLTAAVDALAAIGAGKDAPHC